MVTSLHAQTRCRTPRCSSTTRRREGRSFLYERDPMSTCSYVAQSSSAQVLCVQCGPHQRSHKCVWLRTTFSSTRGPWAMDEIVRSRQLVFHSTCDVRAHFVGAQRTMTPPSSTPRHAACVFLLFADRVCTANLPCLSRQAAPHLIAPTHATACASP
jgi:hypothetical protein